MHYVPMLFLGHVAASLLIADASGSDRAAAVAGNLLPDVTDKTAGWILRLWPSRWLAHGLPCYLAVCALARLFLDEKRWRGFALGYAGHLLCDLWAGGRVPWCAPFEPQRPYRAKESWPLRRKLLYLAPEFVGAPIVWRLLSNKQQATSNKA
jgi:hypothetical protein